MFIPSNMNAHADRLPDIDATRAEEIAETVVKKATKNSGSDVHFVLLTSRTKEYDFGWVFFYNTKEYLDTGNIQYSVPGRAPFIVNRDGSVVTLSSSGGTDYAIKIYQKKWEAARSR